MQLFLSRPPGAPSVNAAIKLACCRLCFVFECCFSAGPCRSRRPSVFKVAGWKSGWMSGSVRLTKLFLSGTGGVRSSVEHFVRHTSAHSDQLLMKCSPSEGLLGFSRLRVYLSPHLVQFTFYFFFLFFLVWFGFSFFILDPCLMEPQIKGTESLIFSLQAACRNPYC